MNGFRLHLYSALQCEAIDDVTTFVGEDESGHFGLMAGHERMMTSLVFGLARFRRSDETWEFLAVPKALLYGTGQEVHLICRRYLRDTDLDRITHALDERLRTEERSLEGLKETIRRLEEELFRRLMRRGSPEKLA